MESVGPIAVVLGFPDVDGCRHLRLAETGRSHLAGRRVPRDRSGLMFIPGFRLSGFDFGGCVHSERSVRPSGVVEMFDVVVDRGGELDSGLPVPPSLRRHRAARALPSRRQVGVANAPAERRDVN